MIKRSKERVVICRRPRCGVASSSGDEMLCSEDDIAVFRESIFREDEDSVSLGVGFFVSHYRLLDDKIVQRVREIWLKGYDGVVLEQIIDLVRVVGKNRLFVSFVAEMMRDIIEICFDNSDLSMACLKCIKSVSKANFELRDSIAGGGFHEILIENILNSKTPLTIVQLGFQLIGVLSESSEAGFWEEWRKALTYLLEKNGKNQELHALYLTCFASIQQFVENAPEDQVFPIIDETFLAAFDTLVTLDNTSVMAALYPVASMTFLADEFSIAFLPRVISLISNGYSTFKRTEVKLLCIILRNFAACEDNRVIESLLDPTITSFLEDLMKESNFSIIKEAIIIICFMINSHMSSVITYVLENHCSIIEKLFELIEIAEDDIILYCLECLRVILEFLSLKDRGLYEKYLSLCLEHDLERVVYDSSQKYEQPLLVEIANRLNELI